MNFYFSTNVSFHMNQINRDTFSLMQAKEYTRALNATKLDRVFAKPFLYALDSHCDGVYCMRFESFYVK